MKSIVLIAILLITLAACSNRKQETVPVKAQVNTGIKEVENRKQMTEQDHLYNLPMTGMVYWIKQKLHR